MNDRPVTIVVLGKFAEVFKGFFETVEKIAPNHKKILVRDGDEIFAPQNGEPFVPPPNWAVIQGYKPFQMAGNGNLGLKAVSQDSDIIYCGDDVRFLDEGTVETLQRIAYSDELIGILSPQIIGRGSPVQTTKIWADADAVECVRPLEMWFPCVYIKREVINKIGYLDEQFNEFGSDDLDYCIRAVAEGYNLAVAHGVVVQHEGSPEGGPTTFCKVIGADGWQAQQSRALEKIRAKYRLDWSTFDQFLQTNDTTLLNKKQPVVEVESVVDEEKEVSPEDAMSYLRSRKLYVATPAYGGWISVNYANSLLGLVNLCRDLGIEHTISFKYNESLIPRARNSMVDDYLRKSNYSDFLFIDADIGFDPREVVSLLLRKEGVIGAPCVRKSLNWTRISSVIKQNEKVLPEEVLTTLGGEFVLNFPPDKIPASVNLGELLEVQEVGTGLIRIRREVFDQFKQVFPNRYYYPMGGEGEQLPTYMFFQSCIDQESGKHNPGGIPHYIPEDYAFCRDCRRAGMSVWLAPWMKTSHMGSFMFQGDMPAVAKAGGALR